MLASLATRLRSLFRGLRRSAQVDADMKREFREHIILRTDDLVRRGLPRDEAERQARLEFGSPDHFVDEGRAARGLARFDDLRLSALDFKLGFRMLARYPGLTVVGGLAMAFAIWIGAGVFELARQVLYPTLPIAEGARVVGISEWDASANKAERLITRDFLQWKTTLRSIDELGAFQPLQRTLITDDGRGEPVESVAITAAAFDIARVPALFGRSIGAEDEQADAAPVAVIGYDLWQSRFNGDRAILGRSVRLANDRVTIVGVMPKGFAYPVAYELWTPLRLDPSTRARRGQPLMVVGRLAAGASLQDAQQELVLVGARAAATDHETHEHLRPRVQPFASSIFDASGWVAVGVGSTNLPALLLVALLCCNVALLTFARAATRERELIVRNALGASRRRIVMQLFAEAFVLSGLATAVGLAGVVPGLRWVMRVIEGEILQGTKLPFWFEPKLSALTVLYAVVLALLAAIMAGVVPGLKVTRGVGERLKQSSAGMDGLRFGGVWTAIIIIQIAVTVAFPFVTAAVRSDATKLRDLSAGVADAQFLTVGLAMDRDGPDANGDTTRAGFMRRYARAVDEFEQRVLADGGAAGVAIADHLPRQYHPHRLIRMDDGGAAPIDPQDPEGYRVGAARVGASFFSVFDVPALQGRLFNSSEYASATDPTSKRPTASAVLVNESFVKLVLGGRNPIGRRLRYIRFEDRSPRVVSDDEKQPWYEIVGVVRDMGTAAPPDRKVASIYHAAAVGDIYPANIAIRVKGEPAVYASKLRTIAAINPSLRLNDVLPMNRLNDTELEFYDLWFRLLIAASVIVLGLSLAGIYAVMSFNVSRRTREIGVRIALGADRRRVVLAVFRRPLTQVVLGIGAGVGLLVALTMLGSGGLPKPHYLVGIVADALLMLLFCLLACVVPTRRALAVEPTEALRAEG